MREPINPLTNAGEPDGSGDARAARPAGERRSPDRVPDDQKWGRGAMSALSRLQMQRRRAALRPDSDGPSD
jgi:hypothetical protein